MDKKKWTKKMDKKNGQKPQDEIYVTWGAKKQ